MVSVAEVIEIHTSYPGTMIFCSIADRWKELPGILYFARKRSVSGRNVFEGDLGEINLYHAWSIRYLNN